VSQVVTQREAHLHNVTQMSAAFREAYPAGTTPVLVIGGPRFDESAAPELGVDRIFVKGTTPSEVASYLAHRLCATPTTRRANTVIKTKKTAKKPGKKPGKKAGAR
jgi:beta-lysine 5,6-aminomutase beta subunit